MSNLLFDYLLFDYLQFMDNYDDIINLPHYEPKHHPRMSMWNRAAQFAPFAALTGYDDAIRSTLPLATEGTQEGYGIVE